MQLLGRLQRTGTIAGLAANLFYLAYKKPAYYRKLLGRPEHTWARLGHAAVR